MKSTGLFVLSLTLCLALLFQIPVDGRFLSLSKPHPSDAAAFARWLVSLSSWGVLKNVVSFSDGLPDQGLGIPYFYLTTLDPTACNALKDQRSSFTVSEYPVGTCGKKDPENPSCAKITLTGKLKLLDKNTSDAKFAQTVLFAKHPEMKSWPKNHNFRIFKLEIEDIFLINWFGGAKPLTVDDYLQAKVTKHSFIM